MTKVLLVEDDRWLGELFTQVLEKDSYDVKLVSSGHEAIDAVDDFKPEVLVVDVLLSGSTVFAFLHELQSYDDTKSLPIILCTNIADQFSVEKLQQYGIKRVVDKTTMHPEDIVAAVRSVTL